jgi:hypothetical protein
MIPYSKRVARPAKKKPTPAAHMSAVASLLIVDDSSEDEDAAVISTTLSVDKITVKKAKTSEIGEIATLSLSRSKNLTDSTGTVVNAKGEVVAIPTHTRALRGHKERQVNRTSSRNNLNIKKKKAKELANRERLAEERKATKEMDETMKADAYESRKRKWKMVAAKQKQKAINEGNSEITQEVSFAKMKKMSRKQLRDLAKR